MALAKDLMQVGIADQAALLLGLQGAAVTSAGTTNADAAVLNKSQTLVVVTGAAASGVKMAADTPLGVPVILVNGDANAKLLYPGTGNNFNGKTATTGTVALAANATTVVWRVSATQFAAQVGG